MLIGMVRIKFVAILIGPAGVGLVEIYNATLKVVGTIAGLGLQSSAVRDIAEAAGSDDKDHIGRTVLTLRRMCWLTGGIGSLAVALASRPLSQITFGNPNYAFEISVVGLTIFFANVQGGQMALIQGMRKVADLARLKIYGVISGSVVSVAIYTWLGMKGIVPAIVVLGGIQLIISWWFARKIAVPQVSMNWGESFKVAGGMIRLGLAFMWSALLTGCVAYATRILITQKLSMATVGIFSAAYALSGLIVNFILSAMAADYYPSLTAVNKDHSKMRTLVNRQTEVGILLALPGLLGTLALAPWAIKIFYTAEFAQASDLLQWFSLGCLGRVISWPLGFIILAKGASRLLVMAETITNVLHVGLIIVFLHFMGIEGVAIAFWLLYIFHIFLMLIISRKLINFSWSSAVLKLFGIMIPLVTITFAAGRLLPELPATIAGLVITAGVSAFSLHGLSQRLGPDHKLCNFALKIPILKLLISTKSV